MIKKTFLFVWNNNESIIKGILFALSVVLIVSFFPKERTFRYEFQKGKPWMHKDLIATFDFAIHKSDVEINKEKFEILKDVVPYYAYNHSIYSGKRKQYFNDFNSRWRKIHKDTTIELKKNYEDVRLLGLSVLFNLYNTGIIRIEESNEALAHSEFVLLIKDKMAEQIEANKFFTIKTADNYINNRINSLKIDVNKKLLSDLIKELLSYNIVYDFEKNKQQKKSILDKISLTHGKIQIGEKIVSKGELITNEKYLLLESFKKEYEKELGTKARYYWVLIGQTALVCVSIIVLILFLISFRKDIFYDNKRLLFILLLIYLMVFAVSEVIKYNVEYIYLVPICIVPVIVRSFYDTRLALFVHLVTIIITGFLVPNAFDFVFIQLIAGIITIISIVKLQRRSQFFLTSILIFSTYSLIYSGMMLMQDGNLENIEPVNYTWFAGSALLTLVSYPLIYLFEKVFGFVTDVSLMELSDTNSKLLRELSLKAPGTFQHSLRVANLAEEVVYQIGGNPLLARTGALYHDIGKVNMPLYFIENQKTEVNPHDELSYVESAEIITSHVINGIEHAKKNNIPEQVIDFIRTHHGVSKAYYFYSMFKKDAIDEEVDESVFSYHGPIPFSKETAVVMITDSVEAASRSLKSPTEEDIENLVGNVINSQINANQFVNADITFKDISTIKAILIKQLLSLYHIRIEYPD